MGEQASNGEGILKLGCLRRFCVLQLRPMVSWKSDMRTDLLRKRVLSAMIGMALLGCGMRLTAQNKAKGQNEDGDLVREIHPVPTPTPFPIDAHTRTLSALPFLPPERMAMADQELVAANQMEIARRAGLQGFDLERGDGAGWGYEQAVCPVFPDHLILDYSRSNGAGDVSLFSVVIPRGSATGGHVRVIPVRRRSYSLWTPAASNELTVNDFNHMVKEGGKGVDPDWLTLGLCYTALAGGHVRAALVPATAADEVYPLFVPAKLSVSGMGGAQIHLADLTHYPEPKAKAMDWVLTFAQSGRLLKVKHEVADEVYERPLPATPQEKAVPVKGQVIEVSKPGN
jgi:hypothetical protein